MKLSKSLLASAVALFASATLSYADLVVDITGSTAFRAAAHAAIVTSLQNPTAAYTGSSITSASQAIFVGTVPGITGTVTVRTSWSGSATGIGSVAQGTSVNYLATGVTRTSITYTSGTNTFTGGTANTATGSTPAVPKFTFSDVSQGATSFTTPSLQAAQVGVVPFRFVANDGAPAGLTNVTDQLFAALYSTGSAKLSLFTNNSADESAFVLATGRDAGSGTRITVLAETGYGITTPVQQFIGGTPAGDQIPADSLVAAADSGNSGYSSGGTLRDLLSAQTSTNYPGVYLIGYLGISDSNTAVTNGAKALTYNGVAYSADAVKNGTYSLWGYQFFLNSTSLTTDEDTFRGVLINNIDPVVTTSGAGISLSEMKVNRSGVEGGLINSL